ncbi:hypothetical protein [Intestinibacter sp.]|uniref:hypothetical protein n=1 Tax=Intestinibacter sp. TaxID=1965304 RepID=UPI003F16A468
MNGSGAVTWYLSYCNLIDVTKGNYDGLRTRYSDNTTNADMLDGYHEYSFLRYRDTTSTNGAATLWS